MDQSIKLKIDGDTSALVSAVKNAMAQIQKDVSTLKLSPTASGGMPSMGPMGGGGNKNPNQKSFFESETRAARDYLNILRQISVAEERLHGQRKIAQIQATNPNNQGGGGGGTGGGGGNIGRGGITSLGGLAMALGIPALAIGGVSTAIAGGFAGEEIRKYYGQAANRARTTAASTFQTQGQGGQLLNSFLNGGAAQEMMFRGQTSQGRQIGDQTFRENYMSPFRLFTNPGESMDALGLSTKNQHRAVLEEQRQEQADIQRQATEDLKRGPEGALRTSIGSKYLNDWQRNLSFQRQMGQGESGFRGFLGGVNSAGFADDQGMGMSSSIMGAGGSTRASSGSAVLALQAQRNLDMTNAGGVIGKLSNSIGDSKATNQAFVSILAEGTRLGLDGSQYREENRKFTEAAAQAIGQSGAASGGGIGQILEQFGKFFGDKTGRGIEAGRGAYEISREDSMATTGPRGVMRAAGMMRDPLLRKLGGRDQAALSSMPSDQLTEDNPSIQAMARKAGTTAEAIIGSVTGINSNSANIFKETDTARNRLMSLRKKYAMGNTSNIRYSGIGSNEIQTAFQDLQKAQLLEHPEFGQDFRKNQAFSDAQSMGNSRQAADIIRDSENAKKNQVENGVTGRAGDQTEKEQANAARLANELFLSIQKSIIPANTEIDAFTKKIDRLVQVMQHGSQKMKDSAIRHIPETFAPADIGHEQK